MKRRPMVVAAGGTGGHLFPAFALAEELRRREWEVDLMTDLRGDRYGTGFPAREVHRVPAATFERRAGKLIGAPWTLARGVAVAYGVLRRVRPAAMIGFGGYPTVPPLLAGAVARVPRAVHEQNAVMGRANRLLAPLATVVALSFDDTQRVPAPARGATRATGNPVRDAVVAAAKRPYAPPVADNAFRLLIFGGSQGAHYFSETAPKALALLPEHLRRRLAVVQQCRQEDLDAARAAYLRAGVAAELAPFFTDLPERIARAHLVLARSGASTVAELAVLGRPAILVPFPFAIDRDQFENARRLQQAGAAWAIPQSDLTPERLASEIERLAEEPRLLSRAAEAGRGLGRPDAVARLADLMEELAARSARPA